MQLEPVVQNPQFLRRRLAAAALALLGSATGQAEETPPDRGLGGGSSRQGEGSAAGSSLARTGGKEWQIDAGALYYGEGDGRVQTGEAVVHLRRTFADESTLNINLTVDALTGGSPNGALPSKAVQTFATPSGGSLTPAQSGGGENEHSTVYTVAAGQLPMDKSFHDQRFAASAARERAWGDDDRLSYGAAVSRELDFQSLSANLALAHDFNQRNTTLSCAGNLEADSVMPIGGAPVAGSDYAQFRKEGSKNKHVSDMLVGLTQVMSRRWLTQVNFSRDHSSGYQNDPYKIVSVLNSDGSIATDAGGTAYYVYESRPVSRTRLSWYWDNKFAFDRDVLQLSLRYMSDDWGIRSHTVDAHYRWALDGNSYVEPHLRRYHQSAADFFTFYLPAAGGAFPDHASADPRLARFDATTLGMKWGSRLGRDGEVNVRIERYVQKGDGPGIVPAQLQGLDLYPGLQAWLLQGGLRFVF